MTSSEHNVNFVLKSLLAGGVSGMCSKTAVAPLDRMKILLQAHNEHYKKCGVLTGLKEIVKRESFFALYKGNSAQMVRIFPYAAIQFTSFEIYKSLLSKTLGSKSHMGKFLSGSMAGVTAVTLTYPLDTIRVRLAFQVTGQHVYSGIVHTAMSIVKQEGGLKALYKGFTPTLCAMVPYAGLAFYSFEMLKLCCIKYVPQWTCQPCTRNTGGVVLTIPAKLLCGGFAGAIVQSFSYPLDVTRRRMQLAMMNPDTHKYGKGMVKTLVEIYNANGIVHGLYRGMSINYVRAIPMVAVSFAVYELMKQALNLDTGADV